MSAGPVGLRTYQVRFYVAAVHTLGCQAVDAAHARHMAEALWWRGDRDAFHVDDVLQAAPDVVEAT